jgi:hypothetical protein
MFCDFYAFYVLKLLPLETITFSDAMLSDINVVLCYVLSQFQSNHFARNHLILQVLIPSA